MGKNLYEHQEFKNGEYLNKFVFIHDDTFARAFESEKEILEGMEVEELKNKIEVKAISNSNGRINIFLMIVHSENPIESETDLYELDYKYERLDDCYYYTGNPCNYTPIKRGE